MHQCSSPRFLPLDHCASLKSRGWKAVPDSPPATTKAIAAAGSQDCCSSVMPASADAQHRRHALTPTCPKAHTTRDTYCTHKSCAMSIANVHPYIMYCADSKRATGQLPLPNVLPGCSARQWLHQHQAHKTAQKSVDSTTSAVPQDLYNGCPPPILSQSRWLERSSVVRM